MGIWTLLRYESSARKSLALWMVLALLTMSFSRVQHRLFPPSSASGDSVEWVALLDSLSAFQKAEYQRLIPFFDPNRQDSISLVQMGCEPYAIRRWMSFLSKGYSFRDTAQLRRIARPAGDWWQVASTRARFAESSQNGYRSWGEADAFRDSDRSRAKLPERLSAFSTDTLSVEDWVGLGLSEAQAAVAQRFVGGRALDARALSKLKVLRPELLDLWKPHLRTHLADSLSRTEPQALDFDWNEIDAAELGLALGWDAERADKLINYRQRMGGFKSLEQLRADRKLSAREYEKLSQSGKTKFGGLQSLDLNRSALEELAEHPYIGYRNARSIVQFRESVRPFRSIEELRKLHLMEDSLWVKLAPYLVVRY